MGYFFIKNLNKYVGQSATIKGWVYNLRSSGQIAFLQVRDGTGFMQAIIEKKNLQQVSASAPVLRQAQDDTGAAADTLEDKWAIAKSITIESTVELTGTVTEHPKKPGVYELEVSDIKIFNIAKEYPIGKKEHGPEFLLDHRHLWLRSQRQWAILRIRAAIYLLIEEWLRSQGFIRFDSPVFTPSACEGTTTLFGVDYFDLGQAFLTQSGQLYLEAGIKSLGRVYDFGPVFRAEKSKTRRHLTEFWMMDAEAAFVEHAENMQIQEKLISDLVKRLINEYTYELEILERDLEPLKKVQTPFERMTHAEAVKKLHKLGSKIKKDDDLGAEDETLLTQEYDQPIFIEKYPAQVKPFYMKRDPADDSRALCSDLLAPEGSGEIIGGSQREDDYDTLLQRIKEHDLNPEDFKWYLDLRQYGSAPSSGFGIGLERLVAWICGLHHVRETIPFPRMINRKTP